MNTQIYSRNLPHILPEGAIYFVTFRLYGSIPRIKLSQLKEKFEFQKIQFRQDGLKILSLTQEYQHNKELLLEQITEGPQYLHIPTVSNIIKKQIHKHDNIYYELICYCIMPNHVHLILDTSKQINNGKPYFPIHKILKLIKGASANYCNKELHRTGAFWMEESYDHYIRTNEELDNIHLYILDNPVKAKLVNQWLEWPGTYSKYPPE